MDNPGYLTCLIHVFLVSILTFAFTLIKKVFTFVGEPKKILTNHQASPRQRFHIARSIKEQNGVFSAVRRRISLAGVESI